MSIRIQTLFMWSELLVMLLVGGGIFGIAGFFPPHAPSLTAEQVAAIYQADAARIRIGLVLAIVGSAGVLCFAAVISEQMRRIPNLPSVLERCQFGAGGLGQMVFANLVFVIWLVAAYRPERDPQITQTLNDMGWIIIVGLFIFAMVQNVTLCWAVFADRGKQPVFPRWVAYVNFWVAASYILGAFIFFVKGGPFAWNGVLAFYVPFSIFGIWIIAMIVALRGMLRRQARSA